MATTFVKNGSNVLITIGTDVTSAPGSAFVKPDPRDENFIVISEKANPQNEADGIRIYVPDVTVPAATNRNDLITQLSTDFFFRVSTGGSDGSLLIPDPDTAYSFRIKIRDSMFYVDKQLTALGFSGAESTDGGVTGDWMNVGGF
jgi:hypothetical protein